MNANKWLIVGALCCCYLAIASGAATKKVKEPPVKQKLLVILLDGFRWDYIDQQDKESLPGFRRIISQGVRAKWVKPIFPSLSYASWTTLSTGLYAENHNIIGNYFMDVLTRDKFELFNRTASSMQRWWQDAEPIWATATRNNLKVATLLWARSDIPYRGILPAYGQGFEKTKGFHVLGDNLERAIRMFKDGYDLIMMYNEHIDNKGHQYGPQSSELKKAVQEVDGQLDTFLKHLEADKLDQQVNVMIVSDHGMAAGGSESGVEYIEIDDYVDLDDVICIIDRGAVTSVAPLPGKADKVYKRLKQMPGADVFRRQDIPEEYHYKKGRYVQEILVVAKKGYFIHGGIHPKFLPQDQINAAWGGFHGYDSSNEDMRTIFLAKGPAFKKKYVGEPIDLVDIYQLYAHILSIPAQANNGTWSRVYPYLSAGSTSATVALAPILVCAYLVKLML